MSDLYDDEEVRLTPGRSTFRNPAAELSQKASPDQPARSRAQNRRDQILDDVEAELSEARDLVERALEDLGLLVTPQHPNIPVLIGQQLEQAMELRRLRQ